MPTQLEPTIADKLHQALEDRTAVIGVIGLGYVGLPLINAFIECGFQTLGYDIDDQKVDELNAGRSYIGHIDSDRVASWKHSKQFRATAVEEDLAEADVILICVPTPLTPSRDPDLSYVCSTAATIAKVLRPGQLVVLESTTYPGTTREVLAPVLEESGLKCGEEYFLAYSPEREDPGNREFTTHTIPKVVGGIEENSLKLVAHLYRQTVTHTVEVSSCEVAEACKILENTYRAVNIAMVNELKMLFQRLDINIWEVIQAASTKPFGFQPFYPGPGLGGHCIPIDPFYLSWLARSHESPTRFIELAGEINTRMPEYVISRLFDALNDVGKSVRGSKIGILGVAYKKDVDDPRESPAFKLMELLQARGAQVCYHDPHIPVLPSMRSFNVPRLASEEFSAEFLADQDCILIATDHSYYDWDFVVRHSRLVIDTRNATEFVESGRDKIHLA